MIIDTHTHLLLTKNSTPDWKSINFYFEIAKINGLDAICFTEHLDAVNYIELLDNLFYKNILKGEILGDGIISLNNSLIITSGAEVSLQGGADVGLHTTASVLKLLNKEKGYYTLDSLVDTVANLTDEYIVVGHHLYRPGKWIEALEEMPHFLDSIELPAKDILQKEKYENLSIQLNKPFVAGSDAHTWSQIGIGHTIINDARISEENFNILNFKRAIKDRMLSTKISSEAKRIEGISKAYRKYLIS